MAVLGMCYHDCWCSYSVSCSLVTRVMVCVSRHFVMDAKNARYNVPNVDDLEERFLIGTGERGRSLERLGGYP